MWQTYGLGQMQPELCTAAMRFHNPRLFALRRAQREWRGCDCSRWISPATYRKRSEKNARVKISMVL